MSECLRTRDVQSWHDSVSGSLLTFEASWSAHLVVKAFEEASLQLRHEGLERQPSFVDETAQRHEDGGLDLPHPSVADDADQRPCDANVRCVMSGGVLIS